MIFFLLSQKPEAGKVLPQGPKRSESIPVSSPGSHGASEKESDDQVRVGGCPRARHFGSCSVGCWRCHACRARLIQPLLAGRTQTISPRPRFTTHPNPHRADTAQVSARLGRSRAPVLQPHRGFGEVWGAVREGRAAAFPAGSESSSESPEPAAAGDADSADVQVSMGRDFFPGPCLPSLAWCSLLPLLLTAYPSRAASPLCAALWGFLGASLAADVLLCGPSSLLSSAVPGCSSQDVASAPVSLQEVLGWCGLSQGAEHPSSLPRWQRTCSRPWSPWFLKLQTPGGSSWMSTCGTATAPCCPTPCTASRSGRASPSCC